MEATRGSDGFPFELAPGSMNLIICPALTDLISDR